MSFHPSVLYNNYPFRSHKKCTVFNLVLKDGNCKKKKSKTFSCDPTTIPSPRNKYTKRIITARTNNSIVIKNTLQMLPAIDSRMTRNKSNETLFYNHKNILPKNKGFCISKIKSKLMAIKAKHIWNVRKHSHDMGPKISNSHNHKYSYISIDTVYSHLGMQKQEEIRLLAHINSQRSIIKLQTIPMKYIYHIELNP